MARPFLPRLLLVGATLLAGLASIAEGGTVTNEVYFIGTSIFVLDDLATSGIDIKRNDEHVFTLEDLREFDIRKGAQAAGSGGASAAVGYRVGKFDLGFEATARGTANLSLSDGWSVDSFFDWKYQDRLFIKAGDRFVSEGDILGLGRGRLLFTWSVDGTIENAGGPLDAGYIMNVRATSGLDVDTISVFDTKNVDLRLRLQTEITHGDDLPFGAEGNGVASSIRALLEIRMMNTIRLESIAFEDGTTPEALGWTIDFASGRLSPNVAQVQAVPEPSSFAVFGSLAAVGMSFMRSRHNRRLYVPQVRRINSP